MAAAPPPKLKNIYYDKSTASLIQIMQVDKVTVQFRVVNDDSEQELTMEEVQALIKGGLWVDPPQKENKKPTPPPQVETTTVVNGKNEVVGEEFVAYISSIKKLKEGHAVSISLEKQTGWAEVKMRAKPAEVKIDLNNLDPEDVKKIMKILESKGENNVNQGS